MRDSSTAKLDRLIVLYILSLESNTDNKRVESSTSTGATFMDIGSSLTMNVDYDERVDDGLEYLSTQSTQAILIHVQPFKAR